TETPVTETPVAEGQETPAPEVSMMPLRLIDRMILMTLMAQTAAPETPVTETPVTETPAAVTPAQETPVEEISVPAVPDLPVNTVEAGTGMPTEISLPENIGLQTKRQTQVEVTFGEPLAESYLMTSIQEHLEKLADETGDKTLTRVDFEIFSPEGKDTSGRKFDKWIVDIDLNEAQTQNLFQAIKTSVETTPLFPSRTQFGSQVAGNTCTQGIIALVASLIGIVLYLWFRFQKVTYGLAAVLALIHDTIITVGLIALSTWLAGYSFSQLLQIYDFKIGLTVLASFLTLIGYSLNDTIVVFDRIREVRGKNPHLTERMIDRSVNQTLARTFMTSFTTLIVVIILYFYGGETIHTFSFVLAVGIIVGTYSSIVIASPFLYWLSGGTLAIGDKGIDDGLDD
ncbi:MAG: protein translocase subunit SecF, partial [Planctomycetia bacterium]|nr:protein translocase subunit SecF [Planctomycetia bacterium]